MTNWKIFIAGILLIHSPFSWAFTSIPGGGGDYKNKEIDNGEIEVESTWYLQALKYAERVCGPVAFVQRRIDDELKQPHAEILIYKVELQNITLGPIDSRTDPRLHPCSPCETFYFILKGKKLIPVNHTPRLQCAKENSSIPQ